LHLADVQNSNSVFATDERQLLEQIGILPLLARDSQVDLSFENQNASQFKAYAIDCGGKRLSSSQLSTEGNRASMQLNSKQGDHAVLAYELIAE
jgi:hypothetical protein